MLSSGIVDCKAEHGQTIKRAYPLDTSDMELPGERLERPDFGAGESLPRT